MSLSNNFPVNSSNLNLSLANAGRLDPRVTFTRATTGTYYDGYSSAKAEENLLLQSQDFATTWSANNVSVSTNSTSAPDGTTTADTLNDGAVAAASHSLIQTPGISASTTYAISVFAKNVDRRYVGIAISTTSSNNYGTVEFDLDGSGAVSRSSAVGTGFSVVSSSITSVGNSWFRCVAIITTGSASVTDGRATIYLSDGAGAFDSRGRATYSGTNASIYAWGAQLEQRSSVTSYTATTTAPITNYIPVLQTAAADVPRFDHNPTTRAALGLLVEEQRANLLTYSDDFSNAAWTKTRSSITSNIIVAPNGTLTGDTFVEDTTASNSHRLSQTFSATSGTTYTASVFVKAQSTRCLRIVFATAFASDAATINPTSGATQVNSGTTATSVSSVGNGWYRFTVSATATSSATASIEFYTTTALNTSVSYTGDGYSGVFIWGAQLETGAFPTSYIATTTASVTRNADVASMTGGNFGWYNQAAGTFVVQASKEFASNGAIFEGSDGSTFSGFTLNTNSWSGVTGTRLDWVNRTATLANGAPFFPGTVSATALGIIAAALTSTETVLVRNGVIATDTSASTQRMPVNSIFIGSRIGSTFMHNGTIRTIRYYPVRNSNAQLQALTG